MTKAKINIEKPLMVEVSRAKASGLFSDNVPVVVRYIDNKTQKVTWEWEAINDSAINREEFKNDLYPSEETQETVKFFVKESYLTH